MHIIAVGELKARLPQCKKVGVLALGQLEDF